MHRTLRTGLLILFGLTACSRDEAPRATSESSAEEASRPITAERLRARIREIGANAVLVNAWATWCDSCEHELPMLQKLADSYASRGVQVLLVSVDEPDQMKQMRTFLAEKGIRLKSYLAAPPLDTFKAGMNPRWPGMLPASFLFDEKGKLRYFWGGEAYENEIVPIVDGLLAGNPIDGETRFDIAPEGSNAKGATRKNESAP